MNKIKPYLLLALVLFVAACSSSGPATSYYTLFSKPLASHAQVEAVNDKPSSLVTLGVGPVVLTGYLKNPSIVSRTDSQQLKVSGSHAWAESLDEAMARVLAIELDERLGQLSVQSFPWDSRARPQLQLRIDVQQFDGIRGGDVALHLQWSLFDIKANKEVARGSYHQQEQSAESYAAYVKTLNELLLQFSQDLAAKLLVLEAK
ncbi:membrane integrity-associated transporter subunit PqiC [Agaribacterium sp. ZY112]|uniref:PqiC family protein n=1 Tax=Agaribacterium sp. ZY112 TaxID=3233574 RepID=UPI0035231309